MECLSDQQTGSDRRSMKWQPSNWNVNPDEVLKNVLICSRSRRLWSAKFDYWSNCEQLIDSQGWNGEYLSLRVLAWFVANQVPWSGSCLTRHDCESRTGRTGTSPLWSPMSHESWTPLTSVKTYLEALDDGVLSEPAPDFLSYHWMKPTMIYGQLIFSLSHHESIYNIELTNFTAFYYLLF